MDHFYVECMTVYFTYNMSKSGANTDACCGKTADNSHEQDGTFTTLDVSGNGHVGGNLLVDGTLTATGGISGVLTSLAIDNLFLDGNTISTTSGNLLLEPVAGSIVRAGSDISIVDNQNTNVSYTVENQSGGTGATAQWLAVNNAIDTMALGLTGSGNTGTHGVKRGYLEVASGTEGIDIDVPAAKTVRMRQGGAAKLEVGAAGANVSARTSGGGSIEYAVTNASNGNQVFNWGIDGSLASEGGTLSLRRYNDAGTSTGAPIQVVRSTGETTINDFNSNSVSITGGTISGTTVTGGTSTFTQLDVDNIRLDGNTISTTNTNGDLVLTPDGTGKTSTTKLVQADGGITVPGLAIGQATNTIAATGGIAILTTGNNDINLLPNGTGTVVTTKMNVDNVQLDGNTISTTNTNGDLNLTPNGTGKVVTSKAAISGGTINGTTIGATVASTGVFTSVASGATDTVNLSTGLIDTSAGNLTIQAAGGTVTVNGLTGGPTTFTQLDVDNLRLDGNTVSTTNTNGDLVLSPNGTGVVATSKAGITGGVINGTTIGATVPSTGVFTQMDVDNIRLDGNDISATGPTNGDLNLFANGTGRVVAHNELRSEASNTANQLIVAQNTNSGTTAAAAFEAINDTSNILIAGITSSGNTNALYGASEGFVESSSGAAGLTVHAAGSTVLRLATNDVVRATVGESGANINTRTSGSGSIEYGITNASNGNQVFNWGIDGSLASEGGTLSLRRYNDAGAALGTPIQVIRSTGETTINDFNSNSVSITGGTISGITQMDVDNVRVDGNTISTTNTNGDLNLTPNGTGTVNIANASITTSLTLENAQYLRAKELAGTAHNVLGANASDIVQLLALKAGVPVAINPDQNSETLINFNNTSTTRLYNGVTQVAQFDTNGLTTVKATVDNVQVDGNTISTTNTNGDLVLTPNGTGKTSTTKLVQADAGIAVPGLAIGQSSNVIAATGGMAITTTGNNDINLLPNGTGTVVTTKLNVDNVQVDGNTISTTNTNGDLVLSPNGTGTVATSKAAITGGAVDGTTVGATTPSSGVFTQIQIDDTQINGNIITTLTSNNDLTLNANGTGAVKLLTNGSTRLTVNANGLSTNGTNFFTYEEGTWTPTISQSGATYTFTSSNTRYTRIGNMVDVACIIQITARTGNVNTNFAISGLPYTALDDTAGSIFILQCNSFYNGNTTLSNLTAYIPVVLAVGTTTDLLVRTQNTNNGTNVLNLSIDQSPAFDANTVLVVNIRYRT